MNVLIHNNKGGEWFNTGTHITCYDQPNNKRFRRPTFRTDSESRYGPNGAEEFIEWLNLPEVEMAPEVLHPYRGGKRTVLYQGEYYDLGKRSELIAFCEELQKGGVINEIYHE